MHSVECWMKIHGNIEKCCVIHAFFYAFDIMKQFAIQFLYIIGCLVFTTLAKARIYMFPVSCAFKLQIQILLRISTRIQTRQTLHHIFKFYCYVTYAGYSS